jgi:hypothetical protein
MQSFQNWIGYFVPYTQNAGDAFSKLLPGSTRDTYLDYIHIMKTQDWSTSRMNEELYSPWIIDPNSYTLTEGEMVSLQLLPDAPEEMYWATFTTATSPIEKPRATAFSYEETLDYTPVYVELDPEDLPSEIGLFVNGKCLGAAVVTSSLIDVCLYEDSSKDSGDLDVIFYYQHKGKKVAKGWNTYNPTRMVFENQAISTGQIKDYAYISFKHGDGESPIPLVTALEHNYPNPFNPNTRISFVLSRSMDARLDIYNVRGQKVKALIDRPLTQGKHTVEWNGRDEQGRMVSSGMYFYRLSTPDGSFTNKMMLMK